MTITIKSPLNPLQAATVSLLKADSTLTGLLAGHQAVYGPRPPEQAAEPYILIGDLISSADNTHTTAGRRVTMVLHIWTRSRSNGPGQDILSRCTELLDHQEAALNAYLVPRGHRCVLIEQSFDQALTDPDPELLHHVLRFTVNTTQLS